MCRLLAPSITAAGFAIALACNACGGGGESRASGQAGTGEGGQGGAGLSGQLAALIEAGGGCNAPADCKSGFCFDGVCCRSACDGHCQSCTVAGSVGTCTNVPVGADPDNDCPDEGVASCGRNGSCDGTGACALYGAGTICRAQSCAGSTVSHAARCDGDGACGAAATDSCGPYMCQAAGDTCRADCSTGADCVGGAACVNGSCGPKPPGAACGAASDCASGFCVEGICCATACTGTCRSCAIAGSEGQCISVPAGTDPSNQCADEGATGCGNDGACDGAGACRKYASGTVCGAAGCTGSTSTPARTCNGSGTCLMVVPASCGAYVCGSSDGCRTSCAASADCTAGNVCMTDACVPAANPDGGAGGAGGDGRGGFDGGGGRGDAGGGGAGGGAGAGGGGGAADAGGRGGGCPGYGFCDDFEDGEATGWGPIGGTWSIVSDGGSVYRGANGSGNSIAGDAAWTDQTVEARVKVVQFGNNKSGFRAGVIARYANATTFYVFLYDGTGGLRLLRSDEMPPGRTGSCAKIDANLPAGSWHTLKLRVSGAASVRLQTFLDGTAVHDCTSTSAAIPAGAAGAYVYGANTIVEFDDVKVSVP
jgi:hypothetical protein